MGWDGIGSCLFGSIKLKGRWTVYKLKTEGEIREVLHCQCQSIVTTEVTEQIEWSEPGRSSGLFITARNNQYKPGTGSRYTFTWEAHYRFNLCDNHFDWGSELVFLIWLVCNTFLGPGTMAGVHIISHICHQLKKRSLYYVYIVLCFSSAWQWRSYVSAINRAFQVELWNSSHQLQAYIHKPMCHCACATQGAISLEKVV